MHTPRDKKLYQRERSRLKQQRYRRQYLEERSKLLCEVETLARLQSSYSKPIVPVPWKEIAQCLKAELNDSMENLKTLRLKCLTLCQVSYIMSTWVKKTIPMTNEGCTWTEVSLEIDPVSRRLGLDWFTKHLYYNTDRMVNICKFPSESPYIEAAVVDCGNNLINFVGLIQNLYDMPLRDTYAALHSTIWSDVDGKRSSYISQPLDNAALAPNILYRRLIRCPEESNFYVSREFHSDDRIVFVLGNIAQDATQPPNQRWRPRLFWYILEPFGENQTRLRVIRYNGPYVEKQQLITWQNDYDFGSIGNCSNLENPQFKEYQRNTQAKLYRILDDEFCDLISAPSSPQFTI
ncbi:hypothetical protein THRCLA_03743 [Thraustotheca clavata]|uniref:Uncharacterized protein n=1 Tax=Thraustotheca clavata TaxID=74557 RepID=A0A1W0A125_9STRA|nr:hypothetical protein THRCLA_03743 [Thraustotheca clavata]